MTDLPDVRLLQTYLATVLTDRVDPRVEGLRDISAGWESDVYALDLVSGTAGTRTVEPLVLRAYSGPDISEERGREFRALQRLRRAGYPVPAVLHLALASSPLGRPFLIMERVPGRVMWWETFYGPKEQQRLTFERFVRLLVDLHALDWRLLVDASEDAICEDPTGWLDSAYVFVDRYLTLLRQYIEQFDQLGYLPVVDWLAARRDAVPCARPAGVHWDYHPANLLNDEDGGAMVIDWTQFEVSDPRFDLAWTLTLVGSQEGDEVRARILATYEAMSGQPVKEVAFFEVAACVKRLATVTFSFAAGAEALGMHVGAEEKMRQQLPALRRVYDRLRALTGLTIPEVDALFSEI
jgi:aminoglycoside phosphotransferase (APT) family kinase protein